MKKILIGILCACACITYADPYYHRGGSDGVRLATDIVNLVGASAYTLRTITTPSTTIVGYPSSGVVYSEPAVVAPVVTYQEVAYPAYSTPVIVTPYYVAPRYVPYYPYNRGGYYRGDYRGGDRPGPSPHYSGRPGNGPGGRPGNGPGHSGGGGGHRR